MKIVFTYLLAFCLLAPPCYAMTPSSLFFTEDEMRQIEEHVQKKPHVFAPIGKHQLHLGTILFYGPSNWSIWLQNEKWTPETSKPHLRVIEVTADYVKLRVIPFDGQAPIEATLRPHQSLNLLTGAIAEGR